ncbi:MAG: hypothetical protein IT334_06305 [Thermomicrobiales bacterium]|nr:hypothetical protein [Thermomicrobiales bacterium]
MDESPSSRTKWYIIGGVVGALIIFGLIIFGLYMLGDDDQSALERLRDIAVIFIVLLLLVVTILLAGITAGLIFLVMQIKDRVIPAIEELTSTLKRVKGTTDFVTEEAVKPLISVASSIAGVRAMAKTFTERPKKK